MEDLGKETGLQGMKGKIRIVAERGRKNKLKRKGIEVI